MTDGVELEFVVERTPTAASKVAAGGASAAQQQQRELTRSVLPLEHGEEDYIADEQDEDEDDDEEPQFEDDTDSFMLREREFCFPGIPPVVIRQDFVCIEGTGGAVWRPSIQFAKFMCGPEGPRCLPLAGKAVLEISSGLGLGAIVAWHLGASPVVATDIDSKNGPMHLLRKNVAVNCCARTAATRSRIDCTISSSAGTGYENDTDVEQEHATSSHAAGDIFRTERGTNRETLPDSPCVQELRWGDSVHLAEALSIFGGFGPDVVLACDVVFDDKLLPSLLETLVVACELRASGGKRPRLCISHQRRNRKREDTFFYKLAKRLGGGEWREVHRDSDLSVFLMEYTHDLIR